MKTIAGTLPNAEQYLAELVAFMDVAGNMSEQTLPFYDGGNGRTLPRYITETATTLRPLLIPNFAVYFPHIQDIVSNGQSSSPSMGRLHDAVYTFDKAQRIIHGSSCVLRDDAVREDVTDKLYTVIADLVVYISVQFGLYRLQDGVVYTSVMSYCEKSGCTPDVFYGGLLGEMAATGKSWFAYEAMSPWYTALQEFDPTFADECSENLYPLSDETAQKLVEGDVDIAYVRGLLADHLKSMEEVAVDVTPGSLISRMNLQ